MINLKLARDVLEFAGFTVTVADVVRVRRLPGEADQRA